MVEQIRVSPNELKTVDADKDGAREQFAIASIILQLSQQCSQPQLKKRRGKDSETTTSQDQNVTSSQSHDFAPTFQVHSNYTFPDCGLAHSRVWFYSCLVPCFVLKQFACR